MDRRWLVKVFSAGLVTLPLIDRAAAYEKSSEKHHKLAIHVDVNDPEVMKLAFNNTRNAHELYKEWGEDLAVEIVAYSQGLHMLRDDTSPVKARSRRCARRCRRSPSAPATTPRRAWRSARARPSC